QADLILKKLMRLKMRLYASHEYLTQRGMPTKLEDLSHHRLICQNTKVPQVAAGAALVQQLMAYDVRSTLTVNNYFGVLQAVLSHLGIGVLPDYLTRDFPSLVHVLPDVASTEVPLFLAYPEELRHSKRVAAFRDFVTEEIFEHRKKMQEDQLTD
ncbi:LysR family transcriptional regulator, partial [Thioclava sp. BHET1]